MEGLNDALFLAINAGAYPPPAMLAISTFLAKWLVGGLPLLLAWLWLSGSRQDHVATVNAVLSVALALACGQIIGALWPHPRPFMLSLGHQFLPHAPEASFPSDHALVFFALGFGLILGLQRGIGVLVLLLGALVGWSRVYLGVHFPFDIAGAFLMSAPIAWLTVRLLRAQRRDERLVQWLERLFPCACPGTSPDKPGQFHPARQVPRFSVVLVNYKTLELTTVCLGLLRKTLRGYDADVWVVDNHSDDASTEYLRSLDWIRLIERKPSVGEPGFVAHGKALDLVLQRVETEFLFLLHTDTLIHDPGIFDAMMNAALQERQIFAVGCLEQLNR